MPGLVSRIERREEKKKRDRQEESGCCKQGGGASAGSTWNAQSRPRLAKGENETIGIDSWLERGGGIRFNLPEADWSASTLMPKLKEKKKRRLK